MEIVVHNNKHGDKYTRQCWDKVGPCVHTYMANLASQNTVHPVDDSCLLYTSPSPRDS